MNSLAIKIQQLPESTRHILLITAVMMAAIIQIIDTTIANVALPHMQGSLSVTQDQVAWVLTSYIIATAIAMPLTGWVSGRIGRKRLLMISVFGFTLASICCGAAQSIDQIILFRVIQGVCGASLVPLSQALLLDTFPVEKHGKAMGIWGVGVMVAPIMGPTLGGWLTEYYSWRWVFYINVPFGILSLIGVYALIKESPLDKDRPFDMLGFVFLSVALISLQMMLDRGQSLSWFESTEIVGELLLAALAFYFFVVHMFTHKHPFIEPGLFVDRNFPLGLVFIFIIGVILLATLALLPPYLENLMGYPVFDAGLILAPRGAGTMLTMFISTRVMDRKLFTPHYVIVTGLCCIIFSMWLMTGFTVNVTHSLITWTGFIQGMGLGFIFVPLSTIAFSTLDPKLRTEAASIFTLVRSIGSSIGISIVMSQLSNSLQREHATLVEHITPFNQLLEDPLTSLIWDVGSTRGLLALDGEITRQALQLAYIDDFYLIMMMTIFAIPVALLLRVPEPVEIGR